VGKEASPDNSEDDGGGESEGEGADRLMALESLVIEDGEYLRESTAVDPRRAPLDKREAQKRESWMYFPADERRRKEYVWLLGPNVSPPALNSSTFYTQAGSAWHMNLCVHTSIDVHKGVGVRALAVDQVRSSSASPHKTAPASYLSR
jgi:hypothetical protein